MKKNILIGLTAFLLMISCKDNKDVLNSLADYNNSMMQKGYHFGDKLTLPKEVTEIAENISISFGDSETSNLVIDPKLFTLGDNEITFNVKTKSGETLNQDATINVFAKNPEKNISYEIVAEYPHDPNNFLEGFLLEGNTVYESDGLKDSSKLIKYTLGGKTPIIEEKQAADIFSEGCAIVGDKIYQLTYQNRVGFIYDKNTFKKISEFPLSNELREGWGLTYDGKNLVATDGSKNLFFLDVNDPLKVVRTVAVAGNKEAYDQLNELEYHDGFIYSNIWFKPIILKIDPKTGEVVGKFDFTKITDENIKNNKDHVLNGIAFKGDNMLITGKNWSKIYEISIK
ncbi:glutamine cyclotransferase [Chryseobacterium ginsenosidimutans]|uniref:glutaminyl-peptide cyclotransferase n=1 Tax=Chryseobacterium ginsenosidimutans TaxID=687846 RepID=UPI00278A2D73|nr:glutaminyl-peptide cyclotransferase [Chryseobacterium ginsenosidimutans]MDQ0594911.1 glutamine cyclotransferase [Chryseobacterium ginsenosidimutans]